MRSCRNLITLKNALEVVCFEPPGRLTRALPRLAGKEAVRTPPLRAHMQWQHHQTISTFFRRRVAFGCSSCFQGESLEILGERKGSMSWAGVLIRLDVWKEFVCASRSVSVERISVRPQWYMTSFGKLWSREMRIQCISHKSHTHPGNRHWKAKKEEADRLWKDTGTIFVLCLNLHPHLLQSS